ncbi:class I SAM-dependent methyltransferase [Synechococcus sp. Cruz-9H2]|uniref:class I SAM-dependent methyltransferase n=1 Tax=unclassified Synechococcus TaxID=2626047 RepID=UPI0020CF4810|nr:MULTISPECIES: class I SAM-dependent methyltransferase [unclassified Synechococcus]MCP9820377.1 class I SAM-dependent methyltransferase [Synechococcus sp. Cruz-9H2]MCP9844760.1 class I SAM-dependent methyltransferase [Synechococcus sp. Edmonson 11F2]MCP9856807.1 class I SAM-dependent methyltransferase [Synechococcus sp. Cruz-9C9]MCP9864168.1 class I SAM-dependent methyltransferase [Synechococcus sp. Cruz-7E5]MCP9871363.1 class I SAM-dependent methyltransferase [Synechococcus sp. Cruz-7B9]
METTWSHGYYPNALYTCGFYREMAPNWLDFAALIKGHRPVRREGEPFRYLELGSGMGLHLCILAAAYPEGTFVGVDFHADQIAHSRQLAAQLALANITFVHGDLIALADGSASGEPPFDRHARFGYVVSHGVYSWVAPRVREALLTVAAGALAIGGLFYCSHNTLPGWYTASIFQHLAEHERRRSDPRDPLTAYRTTAKRLAELADPEAELLSPLARAYPGLAATVNETLHTDPHYLLHEYANAGWEPLYVDDVHPRMAAHQLRYIGSATLPEQFPNLLPPAIQKAAGVDLAHGPDELMIDIGTNKRFRRDLFVHGFQPLSNSDLSELLGATMVVSTTFQPLGSFRYTTSFGEIQPDANALDTVISTLAAGAASLGDLATTLGLNPYHTASLLALMIQADQVALQRPKAVEAEAARFITAQLGLITAGAPYGFLVAPSVGSAVPTSPIEAALLQAHQLRLDASAWPNHLLSALERMGKALQPGTGDAGSANVDKLALANAAVSHFETEGIKKFRVRGVVTGPSS